MASSRVLLLQRENGCKLGEKCSYAHRQVDEQATKRSKIEWWHKCSGYIGKYRTIGLRISRYGAAEVFIDFAEEVRHTEANPTCKNSRKPLPVTQTFETKILRSEWFAQVNLINAAPTLQNLRIGLRKRQSARCPWSSVEVGKKCLEIEGARRSNILHFPKIGVCMHQILNRGNENCLSTPERRCTWSAKRTWILLKWIPWRSRAVLRQS